VQHGVHYARGTRIGRQARICSSAIGLSPGDAGRPRHHHATGRRESNHSPFFHRALPSRRPAIGLFSDPHVHRPSFSLQVKKVSPIGDRVLVKVFEPEISTVGGLVLPSSAQNKPTQGNVVDAGTAGGVKSGDRVVYSKYAGTEVELQKEAHVILKVRRKIWNGQEKNIHVYGPFPQRRSLFSLVPRPSKARLYFSPTCLTASHAPLTPLVVLFFSLPLSLPLYYAGGGCDRPLVWR
jgi:chaperonin GroES